MNELVIVGVLVGLVAIRVVVVCAAVTLLVGPVRACPACFLDTVRVRKGWLRLLSRRIEWRWCPTCGWEGPARRRVPAKAPVPLSGSPPRYEPRE